MASMTFPPWAREHVTIAIVAANLGISEEQLRREVLGRVLPTRDLRTVYREQPLPRPVTPSPMTRCF